MHAERYIKAHPAERLFEHTRQHMENYRYEMGQKPQLKDWQYRQIVKVLQILFVELVKTNWARGFSWQDSLDAAETLPINYATMARDNRHFEKKREGPGNNRSSNRGADGLLAKARKLFPL